MFDTCLWNRYNALLVAVRKIQGLLEKEGTQAGLHATMVLMHCYRWYRLQEGWRAACNNGAHAILKAYTHYRRAAHNTGAHALLKVIHTTCNDDASTLLKGVQTAESSLTHRNISSSILLGPRF